MSNLIPLLSWVSKTKISEVFAKLSNAFLNDIGKGKKFMSSLKLFPSWEQRGENVLLKLTVSETVCFTRFFALNIVC